MERGRTRVYIPEQLLIDTHIDSLLTLSGGLSAPGIFRLYYTMPACGCQCISGQKAGADRTVGSRKEGGYCFLRRGRAAVMTVASAIPAATKSRAPPASPDLQPPAEADAVSLSADGAEADSDTPVSESGT